MNSLTYLFIRLWAPKAESKDVDEPHYVQRIEPEEGEVQWTVTRDYDEANFFKSLRSATRVLRGVRRIADRITRGWLFEIIQVREEIMDSNVPEKEKEKESV